MILFQYAVLSHNENIVTVIIYVTQDELQKKINKAILEYIDALDNEVIITPLQLNIHEKQTIGVKNKMSPTETLHEFFITPTVAI